MKSGRRSVIVTGWAMTGIGVGIVLVWTGIEAASTFRSAPLQTIAGILVVLLLLTLLVPLPLVMATRRARASRSR